ncbi:hypothetical protein DSM112329_01412 [Paraconexibacter sp. AEG42_29]|uniref:HTH gntR-type domain-containing protein n=1 Tax=Paraconexibacter sp. AEG42_29 TaxID=2997339 RepID=A0AAU7ASH6_9ACTN
MPVQGTNHSSGSELLLRAPVRDRGPLGPQVEHALRDAIRLGRLAPGARVPPSRTLARDLGVSRRLVVGAYEQLVAEGWLQARVGAGTFVRQRLPDTPVPLVGRGPGRVGGEHGGGEHGGGGERGAEGGRGGEGGRSGPGAGADGARAARAAIPAAASVPVPYDFFPGHPDLAGFPRAAWGRAVRDALKELPDSAFGYGDPRGLRELREVLAAQLARTRGVVCRPGQIVVCQGVVQALGLIVAVLRAERGGGRPRMAVEDPYLPEHRLVLDAAGAEVVPVPVDGLGVRDEAVAHADVVAALLTPAHQMPTGVILAAGRRAALARWAQATGGLIVEDDYDAEYRYDRAPVPAMQGLAPGQVVYLGSVSKTLAPGLRLGFLVVPEDRLAAVVQAKRMTDGGSPVLEQAALARFIASGAYDRHVRAARRHQRDRRDALVAAVGEWLPGAEVRGIAAGLHALVALPAALDPAALELAGHEAGVRVYPLSGWRADPPAEASSVVVGYGAFPPAAIREGIRRLAVALSALT